MRQIIFRLFVTAGVFLTGCAAGTQVIPTITAQPTPSASATPVPTDTPAPPTATLTATITHTATITSTATITQTPTITSTPTITLTPTRDYPDVTVKEQANCRYGPGVAYLYRWGLYAGDPAEVHGRNWSGTWYWIKPANLDSHCWASEIIFEKRIDPQQVPVVQARLPKTTFAGPPGNVQVTRSGSQVTITWDKVELSEDKRRGYMLEATLCQNNGLFFQAYQTDDTEYTFTDEPGCSGASGALLYTAEKHGYSDPVQIPWPPAQ